MNVTPVIGLVQPSQLKNWLADTYAALQEHPSTAEWCTRQMYLVGSKAVNGFGNDTDVVLVHCDLDDAAQCLDEAGWVLNTAEVYRGINSDGWFSARLGEVNLLVSEPDVAVTWKVATEVCKVFAGIVNRHTTRDERVAFHRAVFQD